MCCVPRKRVVSKALERVKFFRRNSSLTVDAVEVDDRVIKTLEKKMPCSGFQKTVELISRKN